MTDRSAREVSFGRRVTDVAAALGERPALVVVAADGAEATTTWRELDRQSNATARLLAAHGAGPDTMVAVCLANGSEHFLATLGAWKLGACVLPVSPRLPAYERQQLIELLGDRRLVVSRDLAEPVTEGLDLSGRPPLSTPGHQSGEPLDEVPTPCPGKAMGSGGSTGRSKVIVDPRPWRADPASTGPLADLGFRPGQVQLVAGPLYHNAPFSASHYGLFHEHTLVVMERFDADRALRLIERHRVNFGFLTPTMMLRMSRSEAMPGCDLSSLEAIYHTAMACPEWLKRDWIDRVGAERIYEAYGATEAIGHTSIRGDEWLQHPGSVGRPQDCEIRILDESGAELPAGEVGEVFLRDAGHPEPTYRYLGADPLPQTPDGFSSVGDLGRLDHEGYLHLADRRVDLVVTGGVNVYPAEVEAVLTRHPGVHDAVVVGVPDPEWGRRVHAVVQCTDPASPVPADVLADWTRAHLHPSKAPRSYEFVTLLPRDESGKVRRSALAAARAEEENHDRH